MTQPYNVVSSISALDIRTLSSRGALGRSYSSRVGVLPEAAPCVAYVPVDLDGQIGVVVVEDPPGIRTRSFGGTSGWLPLRWIWWVPPASPSCVKHMISLLASDTVRPNAAHTTTITPIIFQSCSVKFQATLASSSYSMPHSKVKRAGSPSVAPPRTPASVILLRCTRASMKPLSGLKRV